MQKGMGRRVIRIFFAHALKYPGTMVGLYFGVFLLVAMQVLVPVYYKKLVDTVATASSPSPDIVHILFTILLTLALIKFGMWIGRRIRGFFTVRFESRVMFDLSMTAFDGLMRHSPRFFSDSFSGSLVRRVNKFVGAFETITDQFNFNLISVFLVISGSLFVLFQRDTFLGMALLVGVLLFFAFNIVAGLWKQKYEIIRNEKDSKATGVLADAIGNATTIKLFSGYAHESALFRGVNTELRRIRSFAWTLHEYIGGGQGLIMWGTEMSMLGGAIILWQRGVLTVGDFVLIQVYLSNIFERIGDFERVLRKLFESFADAAEMVETLDTPYEVSDVVRAKSLSVTEGSILFDDVTFAFHEKQAVLNRFRLAIKSGEKIAFVGSSGAGKTTITRLLLRFFDIDGGTISIDGQDISKVTLESLWNAVALVPQEPALFHRTLKDNIRYGRRDATDAEVIEASKRAHCHEFISLFPQGYDTFVGERGVKLSGGERQRVAIARAILKNAPILVLDEATSSLDSESESLIQDALHELMREKTVIAIAHRLSTIKEMDRIIVIEKGAIAAEGTHETLITQKGVYQKLWDIQAGKFIP